VEKSLYCAESIECLKSLSQKQLAEMILCYKGYCVLRISKEADPEKERDGVQVIHLNRGFNQWLKIVITLDLNL